MSSKDKNKLDMSLLFSSYQMDKKNEKAKAAKHINIVELLSDAGQYSYLALFSVELHFLYNNKWDKEFSEKCLKRLLKHLNSPQQVESMMFSILSGETLHEPAVYIDLIMEEPSIRDNPSILIKDCVLLAVEEGVYDARWRVLIRQFSEQIGINWDVVEEYEKSIVDCLTSIHREKTAEELKVDKSRERGQRFKRYAMIGLASVGGGALIGVTGGLAAPLIGAGIGSLIGGTAVFGALGATGTAIVASLFGAAGAGLTGYKMHRRVGEIEEFAFGYLSPACHDSDDDKSKINIVPIQQQLHITIAVSGWLKDDCEDNFTRPWLCLDSSNEQYYLRYESSYLLELGKAMDYFLSIAVSVATQQVLKYTVLSGLVSAIAWPSSILGLASVIDNPWGVCCRRSAQVGKQLAEVLLSREHGQRPVVLVGFSLGARVIYYCLREMSNRKGCEGIVQDAIMIGAPCGAHPDDWRKLTRVVAGRLVNGFCRTDWLLRFLYRTLSMPVGGVAGLQPIDLEDRRMQNIDLSSIVSGHSEYPDKICQILKQVGIKAKDKLCTSDSSLSLSQMELAEEEGSASCTQGSETH
ncbi:transmembrane and coiled-coil domain-containing protein 4-like [Lycorma delicatula]|uniref:transmembrane and coiled-coil domain-containing protein 4-like n=1 Tax=Lycorma delicatula TaxID=130591 RepID=UPI003F50F78E